MCSSDLTQTGGLILAGAAQGPENVKAFVESVKKAEAGPKPTNVNEAVGLLSQIVPMDNATVKTGLNLIPSLSSLATKGNGASTALTGGQLNPTTGSMSDLVSAGKLAGSLADKNLSGLPSSPESNIAGTIGGLFKKITSTFKPFQANKPVNLTTVAAKNEAERQAENATAPAPTSPEIQNAVKQQLATDSKVASTLN